MNDNENKTNAPIKLPDLLPCPFCGGKAEYVCSNDGDYIECTVCTVGNTYRERGNPNSCHRWNTRNEADALRSILADALVVIERSKGITESRADYDDLCTVRNRINAAIKPNAAAGEQKP